VSTGVLAVLARIIDIQGFVDLALVNSFSIRDIEPSMNTSVASRPETDAADIHEMAGAGKRATSLPCEQGVVMTEVVEMTGAPSTIVGDVGIARFMVSPGNNAGSASPTRPWSSR